MSAITGAWTKLNTRYPNAVRGAEAFAVFLVSTILASVVVNDSANIDITHVDLTTHQGRWALFGALAMALLSAAKRYVATRE